MNNLAVVRHASILSRGHNDDRRRHSGSNASRQTDSHRVLAPRHSLHSYQPQRPWDGWNVGESVSQANILVLVLSRVGELHAKPVAFAVKRFQLESQFVTKMQPLQNLCQRVCIGVRRSINRQLWIRPIRRSHHVFRKHDLQCPWGLPLGSAQISSSAGTDQPTPRVVCTSNRVDGEKAINGKGN